MTPDEKTLQAAYAPLRQELATAVPPAGLEAGLLAAFRQQRAPVSRWQRLVQWVRQDRGLYLSLGGSCVAALAALMWLRPMLWNETQALQAAPAGTLAPTASTELTTAFFPLGDPARIEAAQHARMVRVSMPRASLAAYGLPVNPELADEAIEADLLVGDDGAPLALRFVRGKYQLI